MLVDTDRLRMHVLQSGPEDGIPVVLLHGNLSTARFYSHLFERAPERYRLIAPDMRGFGDSEKLPIDATRGLRDWADDTSALLRALGISRPVHLAGWSTGGAAIAAFALERPVASLTFIDPVSPFGFGGVNADGTPCFDDYAGSGGGTGSQELAARIAAGDRSAEAQTSPRSVLRSAYWRADHVEPREDELVDEILKTLVGDDGYPGDAVPSRNWPGVAPGARGILNALSPKYCNWTALAGLDPKPPVLWTHGSADVVVSDRSSFDLATLGSLGVVPDWPGIPPQPMVAQIRELLEPYGARIEFLEGSGHAPFLDAAERWADVFFDFLGGVE